MKMSLKPLRNKYSLNRENANLIVKGKYFTYSPLGLKKLNGMVFIPIKDITDVGVLKIRNRKVRTVIIVLGLITILFDKVFGRLIFDILGVNEFDTITVILIGIWMLVTLCYFTSKKTLFEISTEKERYCVLKGNTDLEELISLIKQ